MKNGWQWGLVNRTGELLNYDWLQRLNQYEHLWVGYSGGLDSTVLLTAVASCPELQDKVMAVHVHHGLSPHADRWLEHCERYCQSLNIPCKSYKVHISHGSNLEERARTARYQVFKGLLGPNDALLLAHQQNDQCETVLLNLFRGSGLDGLCAMPEERVCGAGVLLRPLLHYPRQALQNYAQKKSLFWIDDEMNTECEWSRVYLRQEIIPLLQVKWPNLIATVATGAHHCQQAKQILDEWVSLDSPDLSQRQLILAENWMSDTLRVTHILRAWLKYHTHRPPSRVCLQQILNTVLLADADAMPSMQIESFLLKRYQDTLYLLDNTIIDLPNRVWECFPEPFVWSNNLMVLATPNSQQGVCIPKHSRVELRLRQGGEKIQRNGQTQCLKKLLQQWRIPPWERAYLPLLFVNDHLMAVADLAYSDLSLSPDPCERYTITTQQK